MFKKILFFSLILSCYMFADVQNSIGAKIQKLRDLPKSERFKLINEIKRDLTKLNSTQRREAISKLRSTMTVKHNQHQIKQHRLGQQDGQMHQRKMDGTGPSHNINTQQHQQNGQGNQNR